MPARFLAISSFRGVDGEKDTAIGIATGNTQRMEKLRQPGIDLAHMRLDPTLDVLNQSSNLAALRQVRMHERIGIALDLPVGLFVGRRARIAVLVHQVFFVFKVRIQVGQQLDTECLDLFGSDLRALQLSQNAQEYGMVAVEAGVTGAVNDLAGDIHMCFLSADWQRT